MRDNRLAGIAVIIFMVGYLAYIFLYVGVVLR
jgi:hypothetical protein